MAITYTVSPKPKEYKIGKCIYNLKNDKFSIGILPKNGLQPKTLWAYHELSQETNSEILLSEIVTELLRIGKIIDELLIKNKSKSIMFDFAKERIDLNTEWVNEFFLKREHRPIGFLTVSKDGEIVKDLILNFQEKYGYCHLSPKIGNYGSPAELRPVYDVAYIVVLCHMLYELFMINKKFINPRMKLKLFNSKTFIANSYKMNISLILGLIPTFAQINRFYFYSHKIDEFQVEDAFNNYMEAAINAILCSISSDNSWGNFHWAECCNCNSIFKSSNRNKKYCDEYECKLERDRKRKNKSNLIKSQDKKEAKNDIGTS